MSGELLNPATFTHCFVCGLDNPRGLRLRIHRDGDTAVARHGPLPSEIGYPDRFHGGLVGLLVDEMLVYAGVCVGVWSMTARVSYRLREGIPPGTPIDIRAEVTRMRPRAFVAVVALRCDGRLVAEGEGTCVVRDDASEIIALHNDREGV